jgi:ComF family protein
MVPPAFRRAVAAGEYKGNLQTWIHLLKYERVATAAGPLGRELAKAAERLRAEIDAELDGRELVVTAAPMYASKERKRGFNHAELIARAAVKELRAAGWRVEQDYSLLKRTRHTESQANLTSHDRRANLRGAFAYAGGAGTVAGRSVLLIDDIMTTATTARMCADALVTAGAVNVWVATAARSQKEPVARWDDNADEFAVDDWGETEAEQQAERAGRE